MISALSSMLYMPCFASRIMLLALLGSWHAISPFSEFSQHVKHYQELQRAALRAQALGEAAVLSNPTMELVYFN